MVVSGHVYVAHRKRGDQWYVKLRIDGRDVRKRLGPAWKERSRPPAGYHTRKTSHEALAALLTDARRGTLAGAWTRTGKTFGDATAEWLRYVEHDKGRAASTLNDYRNVVRCYLEPEFGKETPIEKVTTEKIEKWRERLLDEGHLSRRSIQKVMVLLYGVMKRAKRRGWITTNPAEDVERVTVQRSGEFNVLSVEEVEAVVRATTAPLAAGIVTTAAYTGLRLGELRALRWKHVDFATRNVHVQRNLPSHGQERVPKSGKVRSVPLIDDAGRALDALSRRDLFTGPDDYVFASPVGGPLDEGEIRGWFYDALTAAGLGHLREKDDPIVFHDLRHSFGTLAVQVWSVADVKAYMGHAHLTTTEMYVHHVPKTSAAEEFSRFVAKQKAGGTVSPFVSPTDENSGTEDTPSEAGTPVTAAA